MSSRAIRKLQKLNEQKLQTRDELDESSDDDTPRPAKPQFNAFDLLNAGDDSDNDDSDNDENEVHEESKEQNDEGSVVQEVEPEPEPEPEPAKPQKAKKKKKKSKKSKQPQPASTKPENGQKEEAELDEIDRALKDLAIKGVPSAGVRITNQPGDDRDNKFPKAFDDLLSIEPKFLNPKTEMRRLFGDVALENFDQDAGSGRRGQNQEETVDLARALTGRYCPASRGQSLSGATLRQNPLFQGKGEWPLASSGGLSMNVDKSLPSDRTQYKILHNTGYKDVQRQFDMCVEWMDPQRMIALLQHNPYHISTLLQVSEIAKHQGDHAVAADLLERALFNIGRSAHSTFGAQLKKGKARLDFSEKENRELWLAGWKYITDLGMKGTWRTAYEWGKLLLSLNESDPYRISLLIDSLALRGREYGHFVNLCTQTKFSRDWDKQLNIQCSLVLAYIRLNKPQESRRQLRRAMSLFPWVFNGLAQELDLQRIPKQIWGVTPLTEGHSVLSEIYVTRVKDLWNTPEAVALFMEVGDSLSDETHLELEPHSAVCEIDVNVARHVILSDYSSIFTHLPRHFLARQLNASDPLPPSIPTMPTPEEVRLPPEARLAALPTIPAQSFTQGDLLHIRRARHQLLSYGEDFDEEDEEDWQYECEIAIHQWHGVLDDPEEYLQHGGLDYLCAWVARYGVDRGNWHGWCRNYWPLFHYLGALTKLPGREANADPEDPNEESHRHRVMHGPIRDVVGDTVLSMLETELELWMQTA